MLTFFPPFVTAELPFFKQTIVDHTIGSYQDDNLAEMFFQEIQTSSSSLLTQDCTFKMNKKHTLDFPLMKLYLGIFDSKREKSQKAKEVLFLRCNCNNMELFITEMGM